MTAPASSLLSNLFLLGGSRIAVVCMNLVTTSIMARALGIESFGILNFSLSYVAGFIIVVGLGYDPLVTRDVAHDPSRMRRVVESVLAVRGVLALLCALAMSVSLFLLGLPALTNLAIMAQAVTLLSVALGLSSVFQGLQEMRVVALREFGVSLANCAATLLLVRGPEDVVLAAGIGACSQLLTNLTLLRHYVARFGRIRPRLPTADDLRLARESLSFFWLGLLVAVTYNTPFLVLGLLRSEAEVGYFAVGWKLFNFAIILSNIISALFLPRVAQLRHSERQRSAAVLACMQALLVCIVPITMLGEGAVEPIVTLLFGATYLPSTGAVRLLLLNALVVSVNVGLGIPLMALGGQRLLLRAVAAGAALAVAANLLLIPWKGVEGAALATLLGELAVCAILLRQRPDMPMRRVLLFGADCVIAAVPALFLTHWLATGPLQDHPPLVALAVAGGAGGLTYLAFLRLMGVSVLGLVGQLKALR